MVFEALTRREAAEKAGMTDEALRQALKRPHVVALERDLQAARVNRWGDKALGEIYALATGATSEAVRLDASKFLAALAGYVPTAKSEHRQTVTHRVERTVILQQVVQTRDITPHPALAGQVRAPDVVSAPVGEDEEEPVLG